MRKIEQEVGKYLEYCDKTRRMSKATLRAKGYILRRFVEVVDAETVAEINNTEFDKWMAGEAERKVGAPAMNTYNATVLAMVRYYQDMGINVPLNLNLIRKLRGARKPRISYTEMEIRSAVREADIETGLMITVMAETGMRIAELTNLSTREIDGRRIVFIGKGQKLREVYLSAGTAENLTRFLGGREGYVWGGYSLNGEPPSINTMRHRMALAFEMAGLSGFYPHALRHSFATNLQRKGASIAEIKEMMGHSSVATTERYLHEFEGRMEELFDKYQG